MAARPCLSQSLYFDRSSYGYSRKEITRSKEITGSKNCGRSDRFNKPLTPSAELAAIIGNEAIPRTEVTKKIWEYIKANDLQDPADKRNINADAKLKPIFGKAQVTMFEMTKLLSAHLR